MRLFSATGLSVSWPWRIVAVCSVVALGGLAIYVPYIVLVLLITLLIIVLIEYLYMRAAIVALAAQINAGALARKLEVRRGAWGALCHAVNGMLQQQSVQQRLRVLLPDPPQEVVDHMVGDMLSENELTAMATVLVLDTPHIDVAALAAWQQMAHRVRMHAQRHGAVVQGCGGAIVMIFGIHKQQGRVTGLRAALETAQALRVAWEADAALPLTLTFASGQVSACILPGLGYTVFGAPVEQALRLQQLAALHPSRTLLCPEETYVALRSLQHDLHRATGGSALAADLDWQQTHLRLILPNRPPQVVYSCA